MMTKQQHTVVPRPNNQLLNGTEWAARAGEGGGVWGGTVPHRDSSDSDGDSDHDSYSIFSSSSAWRHGWPTRMATRMAIRMAIRMATQTIWIATLMCLRCRLL